MSAVLGLQKVELFKGLDAYDLKEIAARCKWARYRRNEYVVRRDGTDRDVYFVIAGVVRVAAAGGRGRRITFRDLPAGELFGEHSAIDGRARVADVVAAREALVASMSPEDFRAILAVHPSVRERLLHRLTASVRELTNRVLDLGAQPVARRIGLELLRLAQLAGVAGNSTRIEPAPTHKDIASRVGTTREQVTRELSRLGRLGLLERMGRTLVMRDVQGLERMAGARLEWSEGQAEIPDEARDFAGGPFARQRRAILVVELSDSVAMMERDEERTVERCREFLAHATAVTVPMHAGRSLPRMPADGFLAEFPGGGEALRCAFELHRDLAQFNARMRMPPLGMRAGIHVADVIVEAFKVLGDGVNVAVRLAELANAGETVVSAQVRDQITNSVDATIEDLGEQRLRDRAGAVRAFRAWPPAAGAQRPPSDAARSHGRPSVAVIPFQLMSDDSRFEAIGDGLADEIIAALSPTADFFVISRLSSMAFRRAPLGVHRIGELLGAQYVISGSVHTAYPRARLVAELADAREGCTLWTERFEGNLADVFAMQGELARKVVASVAPFVRSLELRRARITNFDQLNAYGITLRGVELMHRLAPEDFTKARSAFETAIERDPLAPGPHAWLAKWHVLRIAVGLSDDAEQDGSRAMASAERALACDPANALALAMDAMVAGWSRHDLDAAERRLTQALKANPSESLAWLHSAIIHAWRGRGGEAIQSAERALSLSPLDPMAYYFNSLAGMAHLIGEDYDRAIELSEQSLRENCLHTPTLRTLAAAQVLSGRVQPARDTMRRLRELEPGLTGEKLRRRYPGRDSPQAERFIGALVAAGLPR